jgi:SAM-dependent methyltransferase
MNPTTVAGRLPNPFVPAGLPPSMFERADCLICGSARSAPFIMAEDDLTGRPGRFTFVRCDECGLVYQAPRLTPAHVRPYYETDYIAHQAPARWGPLAPLFAWAMGSLDRAKIRLTRRYVDLGRGSVVLDVGCGAGTFLAALRAATGCAVAGVDFVDLSSRPHMAAVEFHHGPFAEQQVGDGRFDLVTMWHFLEHDYDPLGSLEHARRALKPGGLLLVEVPRLDSLSFRMFTDRWPGLQAPQHTAVFDRSSLLHLVDRAQLDVVDYLPKGAFPPYFYLFCGVAFRLLRGRGLNLQKAIYAYFSGQLLLLPILPVLPHLNFAMQTVVCRRRA